MSICDKCGRESECPVAHEDDFCLNYVRKPQTNADRIRAMSDEELAEWIYQVQDGDAYQKENFLPPLSKSWWFDWLKREDGDKDGN